MDTIRSPRSKTRMSRVTTITARSSLTVMRIARLRRENAVDTSDGLGEVPGLRDGGNKTLGYSAISADRTCDQGTEGVPS